MAGSDQVLITLITSFFSFLGLIATGIIAYHQAKLSNKADIAADKADLAALKTDEVKEKLKSTQNQQLQKLDDISTVGSDMYALLNNNLGLQLKQNMMTLSQLANLTKDPHDIAAANDAKIQYMAHITKQAISPPPESSPATNNSSGEDNHA